jgi:hypothetical protein
MFEVVKKISGYILGTFDIYRQALTYDEFPQAIFVPAHYIVLIV